MYVDEIALVDEKFSLQSVKIRKKNEKENKARLHLRMIFRCNAHIQPKLEGEIYI